MADKAIREEYTFMVTFRPANAAQEEFVSTFIPGLLDMMIEHWQKQNKKNKADWALLSKEPRT